MPSVLIQVTLLNRKTKQWWLWPVANLLAIVLFAVIYWLLLGGTNVLVLLRPLGFIPAAIMLGIGETKKLRWRKAVVSQSQ